MIEDLSYGGSWLSFARSSTTQSNKAAVSALRGETPREKPKNLYTGKTYNNSEAITEFFKKKNISSGDETRSSFSSGRHESEPPRRTISPLERLKAAGSKPSDIEARKPTADSSSITPGSHVVHAKYGRGLVLRREGSGDNVKLTVTFPGFGQKKLIEKFANLEKV
jgi:DNA helicase-2/ATP-dependent DNA helicase PcrA